MNSDQVEDFFKNTSTNISGNASLRDPQREAYQATVDHFTKSEEPCYVQLPVGCGKTGLMGITPFGISRGRVLIIVPNLTIKSNIIRELDLSKPADCFYSKRGVLKQPYNGPYLSELKSSANIHDCDNAHIVVSNAQQFMKASSKWYEKFPRDYFKMILVDEGHHNAAPTWQTLFGYFSQARVVSYTATPFRADGQAVTGKRIYSFSYTRSMLQGYISPIDAVHVAPATLSFTVKGKQHELSLEDVVKMRVNDWFSKGVALSEACNRNIVDASIKYIEELRQHGSPRMIIGAACSIRHATQIAALYHERGYKAEVLSSDQPQEQRDKVEASLRSGTIDAVIQVQMLGEGYDLGTLSVAAVFRPYRSLAPYIQFIGRILRLANPTVPHSPANKVYVVSHVGLNDERWWEDFTKFDKDEQLFFSEFLGGGPTGSIDAEPKSPRLTLRPFMKVLNETIEKYLKSGYLKKVDDVLIAEFFKSINSHGFDPSEFGLTEEIVRKRLELASQGQQTIEPHSVLVQPQRKKEALRTRIQQEARSIADTVLNRLTLKHGGRSLLPVFPGKGDSNLVIMVSLAQAAQNKVMGIASGERDEASLEQFQACLDASADISDKLTAFVKKMLEEKKHGKD